MSNDTENAGLKEFEVEITETLRRTVTVEAADRDEAEQIVSDNWRNSEYVLDADNFIGVEFEASKGGRELARDENHREEGGNHEMDGTTTSTSLNENANAPLAENQYVKELFSILGDNGRDTSGLSALLGHVSEMENFVKRAEDTISDMKSQLAEMKEVQNHPVKTALQNAIKNLEQRVAEIKEQLSVLKNNIVEGCKNAVAAFKEKGAAALDKLASFFKIKSGLESWKKNIDGAIRADDKAVASIQKFSAEYHTAGRAIKNMARVAVGKQPIDAKKEAGKIAKAMSAPYKMQKNMLTGLKKSIDKAIASLDGLEAKAEARRVHRQAERAAAKKPSLLGQLQENIAIVEQRKREMPVQERAKTKGAEI